MGVENHAEFNVENGKWTKFEIIVRDSMSDNIWRRIWNKCNKLLLMVNVIYAGGYKTCVSVAILELPQHLSFILKVIEHNSFAQYLSRSNTTTTSMIGYQNLKIKCELLVYEHQSEQNLPNMISDLKNCFEKDFILVGQDGQVETTQALIYARSPVIRSMFKIAEKVGDEPMTKIKLIDYNIKVLEEFVRFLESDELSGSTSNAHLLLELGHQYDIKLLKKKAEQLVVHNLNNGNIEKFYKLLCKTSADLLATHLEDTLDKLQARLKPERINLEIYKTRGKLARTLLVDVMEYTMKDIILVASNGEITAKRELLMARSTVLRAIFKDESNEKLNGFKYEMKNYTKNVLAEFWKFVINDEINPDTENALQLLSLADEYNLTLLKSIATQIVIDNKIRRGTKVIYQVLAKTNSDLMWNHFKSTYEELRKKSGLIDIDGKLFSKDENKFI